MQATPAQLVFGRDALLNIQFQADWNLIRKRKQQHTNENNQKENAKWLACKYEVGDKILIENTLKGKCASKPHKEPCEITAVYNNDTVCYPKGAVTDAINIWQIKLHMEQNN